MSKIMIVEDDASLREIYSIRLTAEGYEVVTAGDGEEGLAKAASERPDLVIADVMMPKISGFDMVDILRTTDGLSGMKVIMMTALSSEDQRARGEGLGADRYLVKSQVGIEDVVATVHEVLGDHGTAGLPSVPDIAPAENVAPATPALASAPVAPVPVAPMPTAPVAPTPTMPTAPVTPVTPAAPVAPVAPAPAMPAAPAPIPTNGGFNATQQVPGGEPGVVAAGS